MEDVTRQPGVSKIIPVQPPAVLRRARLEEHLERNGERKLVLILGQAGQGKSTLAATCVKQSGLRYAWVNLDAEDADPVVLFYSLAESLQYYCKELDLSSLLHYPSISTGPREAIPLFRGWARAIFRAAPLPLQIVLDGLDRLPPDAHSFQFIQELLHALPPGRRLILASRAMPPIDIQRIKMSREAVIVDNEQLAFTLEETEAFFRELRGTRLRKEHLSRIHQLMEGWIGGLILLSETMMQLPEESRTVFLQNGFPSNHFRTELFDYLGEEIFADQPERIKDFLLGCSIPDVIEPAFVRELAAADEAADILEDLERRNLFVHSFYEKRRGKVFRFHQLFRDFLYARFQARFSHEERMEWLIKVGRRYEESGELENAFECFRKAEAYPDLARIIKKNGMDLLTAGRVGELRRRLQSLPGSMVREDPWLLFFLCMTTRFTNTRENAAHLRNLLDIFEQTGDTRGQILSLAYLIEAEIATGHFTIPLDQAPAKAEALLQSLDTDEYRHERIALLLQLGFAHCLCTGEARKGLWACENAYIMAVETGIVPLQLNALVHVLPAYSALGDLASAGETLQKVEELLEKHPYPEFHALYGVHASVLYTWSGEPEKAREMLAGVRRRVEEHGLLYAYPMVLIHDLILRPHLGEYAEAETIGAQLLDLTASLHNLLLHGIGLCFLGLSNYLKGDFTRCEEFIEKSRSILSQPNARAEHHLNLIKLMKGMVAYHLHRVEAENIKELEEALDHFTRIANPLHTIECHFALALLKYAEARRDEAKAHLEAGLETVEERRCDYFSTLRLGDAARACALALELQAGHGRCAVQLLSTRLARQAEPELEGLLRREDPAIRGRAFDVLRSIHRSKMPRLHIETFGGFRVCRGKSCIEDGEWGGRQPRLLLKTLIARGALNVPKTVLMEDLWPEATPSAGERNFKVALHRLRKTLEPGVAGSNRSSYIHLREGLLSIDRELCAIDVDIFLSAYEAGCGKEAEGDFKSALSRFAQAEKLYTADFIPEELYITVIGERREELLATYLDMLFKMAEIHERQGSSRGAIACHKKIIQADPLFEPAYRKLMMIYLNRSMRNEALRTYERCRENLRSELGAEPDELTTALYRKIVETCSPDQC